MNVIKRDGTTEKFEKEKVIRVVKATGLEDEDANNLGDKVESWIKSKKGQSVTSIKIRDFVLKEIKKIDNYAAGLYEWYEKLKDKS